MPAKFDGVALIVTDMDRSLRFYRDLIGLETYSTENYPYYVEFYGFSLWTSPAAHEVVFGELHAGEPQQAWAQIRQFPVTDMAFDVDDVDALFASMKEADEIEIVHEPRTEEWGQRTARFFDPDGHLVEISHWLTPKEQPGKTENVVD